MSLVSGAKIPAGLFDPASPTIPGAQKGFGNDYGMPGNSNLAPPPPGGLGSGMPSMGNTWKPPTGAAPTVGSMPASGAGYGLSSPGNTQNLGGVFGQRASPYLGALLQGIFGGANFQQAQQTPRYLTGSFNPQAYMQQNPDVMKAVQSGDMPSAMYHYMNYGMNEGRAPNAYASGSGPGYLGGALTGKFNPTGYMNANPDVAAAVRAGSFSSPYAHFQQYGLREGRSPSGFGPSTGMAPQWMAPRQTPPGMAPQSAAIPAIQQAQPSQMPYLPQPMPAGYTAPGAAAPGTAAGTAQGQVQQDPFLAKYFPTWDPNAIDYSG